MTKNELKKLALENRHRLLISYLAFCPESDANCAHELTQHAVRQGYVQPRNPLPGATVKKWANEGGAVHWACRAALDLILKSGYQPRTEGEWAAVIYIWLEREELSTLSREKLIESFPDHLDREILFKIIPVDSPPS